jgi:peptidoglycan hydrolase CwlO-like protein
MVIGEPTSTRRARVRRAPRLAALAAVAAVTALAPAQTGAQTVDELNARIADAQAQANQLGAEITASEAQLTTARAQASAAAQREAQLSAVLAQGQAREAELSGQVDVAEAELQRTRDRLHRAKAALAGRLVAIYKGDTPDETELLLSSKGFDDLANRADLLGRIQSADAGLARRVAQLRDQVALQAKQLRAARDAQAAYNDRVATARDQIAAVRARAEQQAAALAAARQRQADALAGLRSQVADWEAQVQAAQQVSAAEAQSTVAGWFGDWAIPQAIVMCESGGNFGAVNSSSGAGGAYQIMPSTWRLYGGSGAPQDASPAEQSRIAAQIWRDSGPSAWVCAQ